ncbi:ParA family protein [Amycolatopsis sp. NPDC058986]|uniref:ParA family protein n=1 Tax=unclassified Amycolatopsis TaxID=2618356 RepID=UPI00366C44EA
MAQVDPDGVERFRVTRPIDFDLNQAALAMHAVLDTPATRSSGRSRVGRSRVPAILRQIAREGWPEGFQPDLERVSYWRHWLVDCGAFKTNTIEGEVSPMSEVDTVYPTPVSPTGSEPNVVAVLNQKGGVGKTGLTSGTAGALRKRKRRVLLVDLDPQGHLTTEALGLEDVDPTKPSLAGLLAQSEDKKMAGVTLQDLIVTHSGGGPGEGRIDVVPTSTEMFLVVRQMYQGRGRRIEYRLADLLDTLPADQYDHILIDCPPSLDILTDNALVAADGLLIPVELARTSVRALSLLFSQIAVAEEQLKLPPRTLLGLVPSLFRRPLSGYSKYVAPDIEAFEEPEDEDITAVPILAHLPRAVSVEEAWLQGVPIGDYVPKGEHAKMLERIAIRLDVEAGLADRSEWDALPPLPRLSGKKLATQ